MKEIIVNTETKTYPIIISSDFIEFIKHIKKCKCKCVVITDNNVAKLHLVPFIKYIDPIATQVIPYILEAGEKSKNKENYFNVLEFLLDQNICRSDVIFTLGGGVVGDLGGLVASTYMRGLHLINVPTSLLAQVDSSIGGKNGIDFNDFKNYVGTFYQPEMVYINYSLLQTLPVEEIRNGLIEILVHALIKDDNLFEYLENNIEKILSGDTCCWEQLIYESCQIKVSVVEKDEKEQGMRMILNFGHTFGHAIESSYNYTYSHGRCVSLGVLGACFLSEEYKLIDSSVTERILSLLQRIGSLTDISDCDIKQILYYMKHDKKNCDNDMNFILLNKIGDVDKYIVNDEVILLKVMNRIVDLSAGKFHIRGGKNE